VNARDVIHRCRDLAAFSEAPESPLPNCDRGEAAGGTTRTFLSPPMKQVHDVLGNDMRAAGMQVHVDAAGNLRGFFENIGEGSGPRRLIIGSHLDTVPNAGAFDGILGVVLGIAVVEELRGRKLPFAIEVIGFSEEEGVRFGIPFIGSRAVVGTLDRETLERRDPQGVSVAEAIRAYGLDPGEIASARLAAGAFAYLEFHIEQGPVLESLNLPLGVVEAIAGQSRVAVAFTGKSGHAGTTPMHLRRDALAGAAEWILAVSRERSATATVGQAEVHPGAANVIPSFVRLSLDVRHAEDSVRLKALAGLEACAREIAARRGLSLDLQPRLNQPAVALDRNLTQTVERAVAAAGYPVHRMISGAGHDAMILAPHVPSAMLFLRSPGGISHHPGETVIESDVAAALETGCHFLAQLEETFHASPPHA
jgi:allantoate deiminase